MHLARPAYVRWLTATRGLSPHTVRAYDSDVAALARFIGEHACVARLDRDCLIGFLERQRADGLAAASIKRRASGVRGFCGWLVASECLPHDPWSGIVVSVGRGRRLPRSVPGGELEMLLRALCGAAGVPEPGRTPLTLDRPDASTTLLGVALMIATGVRVNELVSIRCEDIDLHGRRVRVLGKGRRERHVFLPNDWIACLTDAYLQLRAARDIRHDVLLFNRRGDALTPAAMRTRLASAARAANLGSRVTPHMLRHSAATRLLEEGVDIRKIQRLLGHASLSTTEIYTHVSDQALQRTLADVDVLGGMLMTR